MRINSIGRTGPFNGRCYDSGNQQSSKINNDYCSNVNFKGRLSGNMSNGSTMREIMEIVGVATLPVILMIFLNNLFKSEDKHNDHIFLNDGTYLGHTDEFFHE